MARDEKVRGRAESVGRARLRTVEIDELIVRRLRVDELEVAGESRPLG